MTDRELNDEIAERVMGWKRVEGVNSALGSFMYQEPGVAHLVWPASVPDYSTDISAAMQVVTAMIERGYDVDMHTESGGWMVGMSKMEAEQLLAGIESDNSLPIAICKCALSAVC